MSTLSVEVWRGGATGAFQRFEVPRHASQTVLDVVTHIQRALDPTLAYRFACRVGMCGSCAMTVNGRPAWTCRTHVAKVIKNGRIEIGPLANLPVIKDLVADMTVINPFDFFVETYAEQFPFVYPSGLAHDLVPYLALEEQGPLLRQWLADFRATQTGAIRTVDFLMAINRQLQRDIRYLHRPANLEDLFLKLTGRQIRDDA